MDKYHADAKNLSLSPGTSIPRRSRRLVRGLLLLLLAGALLPAGCMKRQEPPEIPDVTRPAEGGVFRIAQDAPRAIDPARMDDSYGAAIINQIFDGLVAFDSNFNTVPCVANSWQISRDGLTYTFHLKEDVRFHNGAPVTAEDFVYTFTRVFHLAPQLQSLAAEYLSCIAGATEYAGGHAKTVSGIEALSPYQLQITLAEPHAAFLAILASELARVVPRAYTEQVGTEAFGRRPIGCGPFRVESYDPDHGIVLTAFDDYHAGRAHLDTLLYEFPEGSARDIAADLFLAGQLDQAELTYNRLAEFQDRPDVKLYSRQELSLTYLGFNVRRPPLDDPRLRRAFAMALDMNALGSIYEGGRQHPNGILPPGMPGYTPEPKILGYDPQEARRLLAEAGFPEGRGLPPLTLISANQSASEKAIHAAMAEQLAAVGFRLEPVYREWREFNTYIRSSNFDLYSITWVADIPDPDSFLYPLFHSTGSNNFGGYSSPEVDALLEQGRHGSAQVARLDLYRTAERRVLDDAPMIPVHHSVATIAIRSRVKGFTLTPMGPGNLAMELVWFDEGNANAGAR